MVITHRGTAGLQEGNLPNIASIVTVTYCPNWESLTNRQSPRIYFPPRLRQRPEEKQHAALGDLNMPTIAALPLYPLLALKSCARITQDGGKASEVLRWYV